MKRGKINLILGPMFSGKTSLLILRYKKYTIGGKKCLMVKYKKDIRYDEEKIVTHDNIKVSATICECLSEIDDRVKSYDVICIDEIQFYKDAYIFCDKWAIEGLIIEACGLNGTFERKPFKMISRLLPQTENIIFLKAICIKTGKDASFTKRLTKEEDKEIIGGIEMYNSEDRNTFYADESILKKHYNYKFRKFLKINGYDEELLNSFNKKLNDLNFNCPQNIIFKEYV